MERIEQRFVNPSSRINPHVERKIRVLEERGDLKTVFDENDFSELEIMGGPENYLAHLRKLQLSFADDSSSEE